MAVSTVAIATVLVYGSFGRPIWIDEFLHFALGSHRSAREAWDTVTTTGLTFNHGQTGVYMMLDYWLLQLFGANAVALRLPSLLSGLLLVGASAAVLRFRGFGLAWQLLAVVGLLGQSTLMYFVGEARPYMPLAAASVGALAYYLAPAAVRRQRGVAALGIGSIALGVLMHPYFGLYWAALFLFSHAVAVAEGESALGWRSLIAHVNAPVLLAGTILYLAIGRATWLRHGQEFQLDPFQWIAGAGAYRTFVTSSHLQFAGSARLAVLVAISVTPVAVAVAPRQWRVALRPLLAPAALLLIAFVLSVVVAYASHRRHYWILPRQWVASIALAPVAVVWFWAEVARLLGRRHRWLSGGAMLLAFVTFGASAYPEVAGRAVEVVTLGSPRRAVSAAPVAAAVPSAADTSQEHTPRDNDGWVRLANQNIQHGGPVWPIFRRYYAK